MAVFEEDEGVEREAAGVGGFHGGDGGVEFDSAGGPEVDGVGAAGGVESAGDGGGGGGRGGVGDDDGGAFEEAWGDGSDGVVDGVGGGRSGRWRGWRRCGIGGEWGDEAEGEGEERAAAHGVGRVKC